MDSLPAEPQHVPSLGWENPMEKATATHPNSLAWRPNQKLKFMGRNLAVDILLLFEKENNVCLFVFSMF